MDEQNQNREFDDLLKLYEMFTSVQLQAETVYYNRTNLVLISEGLLLVALPGVIEHGDSILVNLFAGVGAWLSVIWLLLEQRNRIHYRSRENAYLKPLEARLSALADTNQRGFVPFWTEVSRWVTQHARWYEKHSGQSILRTYTPATFVVTWLFVFVWSVARRL